MQLVFLHGAPATGKLTVARALAARTGVSFVDNHAAIDMARMVFGFAQPGFWDLVHDLRVSTLRGAARAGVNWLITTAAYSHPDDAPLLADYQEAIRPYGGVLRPVHLYCSQATLMHRVRGQDRVDRGKLSTPESLQTCLDRNSFVAIPGSDCPSFSTETATPQDIAEAIALRFEMPLAARVEGGLA